MATTTHTRTASGAQAEPPALPEIITGAEARARGLSRYFTGKPCAHGHVAERYRSGCITCNSLARNARRQADWERERAYGKAWREANPERQRAKGKAWYAANLERQRANCKAWYAENTERRRACAKAWAEANAERVTARTKAWAEANPERKRATTKAWRTANPERGRAYGTKRRLLIEQQTPAWADREAILAIYRACPPGMHVDHVVPIKGRSVCGLHCPANLQYLPGPENRVKGNYFPSDEAWTLAELRAMRAATMAAAEATERAERRAARRAQRDRPATPERLAA